MFRVWKGRQALIFWNLFSVTRVNKRTSIASDYVDEMSWNQEDSPPLELALLSLHLSSPHYSEFDFIIAGTSLTFSCNVEWLEVRSFVGGGGPTLNRLGSQNTSGLEWKATKAPVRNCRKRAENYKRSETHFLEKRKTSYVGSGRSRNVAVARPKPVKDSIICLILPEDRWDLPEVKYRRAHIKNK